jgi:hypothetical protein
MSEFNLMLEFIKNYRMNDHWLAQAKEELELALRLAEYLNPDSMSAFKPVKEIKQKLLSPVLREREEGIDCLRRQMNIEFRSPEKFREVLDYLIPIYLEKKATDKEKKRIELQTELKKLDEEP